MEFTPLPDFPWINNAKVHINDHFFLSVSYNRREGAWYVGEIGSYEVGIMVTKPGSEFSSLVQLADHHDNVFRKCKDEDIEALKIRASGLEYGGEIEVYAQKNREQERSWGHRFHCAKGYDMEDKLAYVKQVFKGEDKWRVNTEQ